MNQQLARNNLLNAVRLVVEYTKTYEHYLRTIKSLVWDLYRGDIEEGDFVDTMADLVEQQLTRAWHAGMRENELDPIEEMEPEWQAILDDIILSEYNYVDQFAADIVAARDEQLPIDPFLSRADMWANRYNDVVNQAIMTTKEQKLLWVYGDTDHCDMCRELNGIVAWAHEWQESPVEPQGDMLQCGGWRCQCELIPTDNRHTRNAADRIDEIYEQYKGSKSVKGGPGSGNFGHAGRPGEVGGSGPGGGGGGGGGNGGGESINASSSDNELSTKRNEWADKLSTDEQSAIDHWGTSGKDIRNLQSGNINEMTDLEISRAQNYLDNWESALDKGINYNGVVYRGLNNVPYENGIDNWINDGRIEIANDQSSTINGNIVDGFSGKGYGNNNSVVWEVEQNSGVILFDMTHVTMGGKPISESEVVLRKGTIYKIKETQYYTKNGDKFPPSDYFEGTDYNWPDNPPSNWWPGKDMSGYWKITLEEE